MYGLFRSFSFMPRFAMRRNFRILYSGSCSVMGQPEEHPVQLKHRAIFSAPGSSKISCLNSEERSEVLTVFLTVFLTVSLTASLIVSLIALPSLLPGKEHCQVFYLKFVIFNRFQFILHTG